ncbi:hypothetical protein PVK06_033872 [Gossypium arboreum]|uniref:Reverse transcriptase zinc-binding domain-containing protein n=1 Tax=Gossypium arboreum TaxID=29729 RepID=A0ABR0NFI9_GOSAR|nr:hypothetical protein PVK06_033872 [Gossypium arboreum]
MALVSWDALYQLKSHGGLGIRSLKDHNTSFIMNLGFNLVNDSSSLWVNVLRSKYVGDGHSIKCWRDSWVPNVGPLSKMVASNSSLEKDCSLSNMVTKNGDWNLDFFRLWLTEDIIQLILGFRHLNLILKRVRRGLGTDTACGLCGHLYESVLHVLRDCTPAREIWMQLIPTDMFVAIGGLLRDNNGNWILVLRGIWAIVKLLTPNYGHWNLQHIPKEENKMADKIIKTRRDRESGLRLFDKNYGMRLLNV